METVDQPTDDIFSDLNRLNSLMNGMDERSLVLSLAAFAEEALGDLLASFLISGAASKSLLDGFNAPLGTFSARIKMASALGLITRHQFDDLDKLRKIRNEVAHTWNPLTLQDDPLASHIKAIHFHMLDDIYPETNADKLRRTISLLLTEIRITTSLIRDGERGAKLLATHIIAGVPGDVDEQIVLCRTRLTQIRDGLAHASGEKKRFLLAARDRWRGKLEIVRRNSQGRARRDAVNVQLELDAFNTEKDY